VRSYQPCRRPASARAIIDVLDASPFVPVWLGHDARSV